MRIVSGTTTEYLYFVAFTTAGARLPAQSSFSAYISIDGSTGTLMSTASWTGGEINSTQLSGVYKIKINDTAFTALPAGCDSREACLHITNSSGMEPVTRTYEIYRRTATTGTTIVVDSSGAANANTVEVGGTTQTARDLGASVLLSSGTGTGQIVLTSGVVNAAVTSMGNDTITAAAVADGCLTSTAFAAGAITANAFAAGAIDANAIATDAIGSAELAATAANEIADAILDRDMSTGADSGSPSVRTVRQALRFLRNKWAISGGTLTVFKEDDSTSSWTSAVTSSATADPIIASDPA